MAQSPAARSRAKTPSARSHSREVVPRFNLSGSSTEDVMQCAYNSNRYRSEPSSFANLKPDATPPYSFSFFSVAAGAASGAGFSPQIYCANHLSFSSITARCCFGLLIPCPNPLYTTIFTGTPGLPAPAAVHTHSVSARGGHFLRAGSASAFSLSQHKLSAKSPVDFRIVQGVPCRYCCVNGVMSVFT